jgi:AcrR family transcriptional regulator
VPRAGLTSSAVTAAGAALADEIGLASLSMGLLAERLGVRPPALYRHVTNLADLLHRIAILGWTEIADTIRDAIQGRAGKDALTAGAQAMRMYVRTHPGRYAAANAAQSSGPDDPLSAAANRMMDSAAAMLRGYQLGPGQELHALRMLRSTLHGFTTFEAGGGFQIDVDVDESFAWTIAFIDRGLQAVTARTHGTSTG